MNSALLQLAQQLINQASITPDDNGCQPILAARLEKMDFSVEHLRFGEVDNLWAKKGTGSPLVVFAGHTDVVPPGDLSSWHSPPFTATIKNNRLYGRGAADMKGSIAAFITALEMFYARSQTISGSIGVLITADEEGAAQNGTVKVMEHLAARGEHIDYCIVGEPSADKQTGDVIKNGRRGSLGAVLTVYGKQGHIAYPHLADNPIHAALGALQNLTQHRWDNGNADFPPTQLQISNIRAGTGVGNVIPGTLCAQFNFRYSTEQSVENLREKTQQLLHKSGVKFSIDWHHSGSPYLTPQGKLTALCAQAVKKITGMTPRLSTEGGTSDGRFIAPYGVQVVELGPSNATIHQINEYVDVSELQQLQEIYAEILCALM